MLWRSTRNQYGLIAIFLHWIMAILVIGLLLLGLYMVRLPISLQKLSLYGWHKEWGILVLFLVIVRLLWRWINPTPAFPNEMKFFEKVAARIAHYSFYILLLALPLTGWMMSSSAGLPVSFFGLFVLPDLVSPDPALLRSLIEVHKWLAYIIIAVLCAHIAGALQHHFYYKDDILRRMLWPSS